MELGIQLKKSGIAITIGIRKPSSTDKESGIHGEESRSQGFLGFPFLGRDFFVVYLQVRMTQMYHFVRHLCCRHTNTVTFLKTFLQVVESLHAVFISLPSSSPTMSLHSSVSASVQRTIVTSHARRTLTSYYSYTLQPRSSTTRGNVQLWFVLNPLKSFTA